MDQGSLISTLQTLRREQRSGVLEIRAEGVRSFFYLLKGELVFAEEESAGETLGRLLVRQNKLTQEQYVQIIQRMTDGIIENEQLRFGEVAVQLGFLTPEEVQRALADQVRWKIIRALQRQEHEVDFVESTGQVEGVAHFALPLEPLILEACRWVTDDRKQATLALIAPERLLTLREPVQSLAQRYQATPDEREFLAQLDGRKRLPELLELGKSTDTDVAALLTALVVTKGIAYAREPAAAKAPPRPPGAPTTLAQPMTPPGAHLVAPSPSAPVETGAGSPAAAGSKATSTSTSTSVHRGVVPTPAQFVPFRGPLPAQKDAAKEKADRALALLRAQRQGGSAAGGGSGSGAPVAAAPPPQQKALDEHEARLVAEQEFQRGRAHFFQGQHRIAHGELEKAHKLQPQSLEYEVYVLWASIVIGAGDAEDARTKLRRAAAAATKADPNFAFGYYVVGELALFDKNEAVAKRAFSHALKLDPNLLDAQRRLRLLNKK